jgi:hypothetical protein
MISMHVNNFNFVTTTHWEWKQVLEMFKCANLRWSNQTTGVAGNDVVVALFMLAVNICISSIHLFMLGRFFCSAVKD